jgi:hypothetical protein
MIIKQKGALYNPLKPQERMRDTHENI